MLSFVFFHNNISSVLLLARIAGQIEVMLYYLTVTKGGEFGKYSYNKATFRSRCALWPSDKSLASPDEEIYLYQA
jgi:hypothetical protein